MASRVSRRDSAHDLFERQKIGSIVFDAEIIHLARKRGYSIAIVPVQWADKRGSRMRVSPSSGPARCVRPVPDPADSSQSAQAVTGARVLSGDSFHLELLTE